MDYPCINSKIGLLKKYNINFHPCIFAYDLYEEKAALKPKKNVIIEAKRVLLNEQLLNFGVQDLVIANDIKMSKCYESSETLKNNMNYTEVINGCSESDEEHKSKERFKMFILRKYFHCWKDFVYDKKERLREMQQEKERKQKLDTFIMKLKKIKKDQSQNTNNNETTNHTTPEKPKSNFDDTKNTNGEVYKSRFRAQQDIISMQKLKLEQQNKLIEDFKLGKITEDLVRSLENTKIEIREIFSNSSARLKCKVSPILDESHNRKLNFELKSEKAPRMVQEMEKRAQERALKRAIILERKRIIDEEKKRIAELILEQKRVQDEEDKKRNLDAIKENRKKELELQKIRQINKQKFMHNLRIAEDFHKKKLKAMGFRGFATLIEQRDANVIKSAEFYRNKLMSRCFNCWTQYIRRLQEKLNEKADALYKSKTLLKYMGLFRLALFRRKQSMQVANDLYDMRLESRFFIHWHRYVCKQYIFQLKKMQKAEKHYKSRILLHYFYQWRKLPAALLLEKARDEKMRKWREKVWEILPDFKSPLAD